MASFVRRDIWSLDAWDPIVLWYARAVGAMKACDDDDRLSWAYQSAMHGTYTQPAEALWNGCQHGSWFFLPWHRIYIWYFEQIVRAAVADLGGPEDWALPYWNYTDGATADHARLPAAFREPLLEGAPNPLFVDDGHRWPPINAGAELPDPVTSTKRAMDSAIFSPGFGGLPVGPVHYRTPHGLLESQPHDAVHGQVGGNVTKVGCHEGWMADPNCAASDPIFYLHHSNIDRVWVRWLGQGGGRANPTHPDWAGREFTCFGADGLEHTKSCGDVADILRQDYRYDDMPAAPPPVAPAPAPEAVAPGPAAELPTPPGDGPEIAAGDGVELGAESTSVSLSRTAAAPPVLDAARGGEARVYLHLDGVDVDGMPGTIWQVRLDPDGPGGDPDRAVGTISFFGRGHAHGGDAAAEAPGVHDERFIFDITDVVQELEAEGCWDEDAITVSFHPVAPEGADLAAVPTVTVNRVYITHG